jgi:NAD(P)H dehydrogenase (quinone)
MRFLVVAHARRGSLTHAVAAAFAGAAEDGGHQVEMADLAVEGFDPVLSPEDEPDWNSPAKAYSPAVQAEMARVARNEATVMVYPIWWWSMPALMKGWIDRVWNHGWAHGGGAKYPHAKVAILAIAGGDQAGFVKRGHDQAMLTQIETGILHYCGIQTPKLHLLDDSFEEDGRQRMLDHAAALGSRF